MFPITRIVTVAMTGVICFVLLLPLAVRRHDTALGVALVAIFVLYLGANVVLWLRLRPRA